MKKVLTLLAIILLVASSSFAGELFDINKPKTPWINKGQLYQVIVELEDQPNADIQYKEGYLDADGNFVVCGVNKVHLQDRKEQKDEEGNIIQEASTDFTDFMTILLGTQSIDELEKNVREFLIKKLSE
jgi:hypothetical protein